MLFRAIDSKTHPYGQIGIMSLNRPKANALSKGLIESMITILQEVERNDRIRGIILESSSRGMFCAGADLVERRNMTPVQVDTFLKDMRGAMKMLEVIGVPTIAVVDGHALGGGLELALCTDLRVTGPLAKLALPETRLGIIPGAGGTQRLTRLIGPSKAKDLMFSARSVDAETALKLGIVDYVAEDPLQKAIDLMEQYIQNSPVGIRNAKKAAGYASAHHDGPAGYHLEAGLDFERLCYADCLDKPDRDEGLLAFKEKRKPVYGMPKASAKL
ncbi:enoyl-CoA hydratase [Protomyces lactucae-debilis]|uniref:Enoyl-CoA hydratase n=1 Tax=Protomyces lactucae-debilis TaxID=2754530 RepID=A0A1Y2FC99_PROLT|nr:enoyl-CoA hydratase [Protomyces lactucae-debilis]ORY81531.1 enoyl-CoA hydratase [Protomyces lactucae-debilis]